MEIQRVERNEIFKSKMETQWQVFKLVSSVAQATEMAKSEIKIEHKKDGRCKKEDIPPPSLKRKYRRRPEYQTLR